MPASNSRSAATSPASTSRTCTVEPSRRATSTGWAAGRATAYPDGAVACARRSLGGCDGIGPRRIPAS